ncbi:hypothetical protein Lsed01_02498 [Demequina sediminis]|uniref:DUF1232 domain-containing protein n=1 Tax=Demequina sediminis TaxID=1930058 RepID=A0ABP9WJN0_9MICO|nr:YkvA family protein [Demequina sediminis]BDZ61106.1 hypothetical protein GCM10025873_08970 [Demequina sediminis]
MTVTAATPNFEFNRANENLVQKLLGKMSREFLTLFRLAKAVHNKDYALATPQIAALLGGLGYVVSPIDLVPDLLPFGLTDDAAVVTGVVAVLGSELVAFREWERANHDGKYKG